MTALRDHDGRVLKTVQDSVDVINEMFERLKIGKASASEANLLNDMLAEALLNGRGAALTLGLPRLASQRPRLRARSSACSEGFWQRGTPQPQRPGTRQ